MRLALVALLVVATLPVSIASAQTPPVVIIGPPPASSGPPPQATPTVPPGYEIEGDLGGMHFRARVTTPQGAPVAPAPQPQYVAPPPPAPPPTAPAMMVLQQPPSQPEITYAPAPTYAQSSYSQLPMQQPCDGRPRLDSGMDFGGRLALEVVGAGIGFGLSAGLAYLINDSTRGDGFTMTTLLASAGLIPTGISIFGGAIAGGRGRFGGAMLGEVIGGGLSAIVLFATNVQFRDPWEQIAAIAGPAILGAILGFEAQHGLRTARLERLAERDSVSLSGLSVSPIASGSGANGAMLGLSGTF